MTILALIAAAGGVGLSVTANPASISTGGKTTAYTTPATTALVSSGSGSYSYAWTSASDDALLMVTSPAARTTTFRWSGYAAGDAMTGTATLVVTDNITHATATVDVTVSHQDNRIAV